MTVVDRQFEGVTGSSGGWVTKSVGGIVAIVLTILGLAHVVPVFLVAIALIAAGAALVFRGAAIAGEYGRVLQRPGETIAIAELGGGAVWSVEFLAGGAAIVLGILALLNIDPVDLVAIGVIALGGAIVLSAGLTARLTSIKAAAVYTDERARLIATEVVSGSASIQALGLTAIVLGILALAGFSAVALVLIALLALGSFILLNGVILSGAMLTIFRRP